MNTQELTAILSKAPELKSLNAEVCAKDLLPEKKPLDLRAYIINTDTSEEPGEHWVALYFRNDQAIYFDSYGQSPDENYVLPFIQRNARSWIENTKMLQSPWSRVCGMYCIYILHQLNRGLDLDTAIHQALMGTGEDLYQNDRDIEMWFSLNYGRLYLSVKKTLITPDHFFKHRNQVCKCLKYTHCLAKKYPMYTML